MELRRVYCQVAYFCRRRGSERHSTTSTGFASIRADMVEVGMAACAETRIFETGSFGDNKEAVSEIGMKLIEASQAWRPAGFSIGKMLRTGEVRVLSQTVLLGYKIPTPQGAAERYSKRSRVGL